MKKNLAYTIGIEVEQFLTFDKALWPASFVDGLPHDGDQLLAEFRGKPFDNVYEAVYSVKAEMAFHTERLAGKAEFLRTDWIEKDDQYSKVMRSIARKVGLRKERISWENLYGHEISRKNYTHHSAGMHISVKKEVVHKLDNGRTLVEAKVLDYPEIFRKIEKEFKEEITASERVMGFYEVKSDGRVEYRSLPSSLIHLNDFAQRLNKALTEE